jgi:hypothetical protein
MAKHAKVKVKAIPKKAGAGSRTIQWTANGIDYRVQKFKGEKDFHFFTSKGSGTKFEGTIPAMKAKLLMRFGSRKRKG